MERHVRLEAAGDDGHSESMTIPSCGKEQVLDPGPLSVMMDIVERFRDGGGCLDCPSIWFNIEEISGCPVNPVPLMHNIFQANEDAKMIAKETEVRATINRVRIAAKAFLEIGMHVASQVKKLETHFKALRLRKGMLSLPDEILAIVLKFTAYEGSDHFTGNHNDAYAIFTTVRRSAKLSHVCQRFRRILVAIPILWNRVLNKMPESMVAACCSRFSVANVEVSVTLNLANRISSCEYRQTDLESLRSFVLTATSFSQYWHRYVHDLHLTSSSNAVELKELSKLLQDLDVPCLTELVLNCPESTLVRTKWDRCFQEYQDAIYCFTTWSMPRLTSLVTINLIPRPIFSSLKKLSMTIHYPCEIAILGLGELCLFLASHPVLEEFTLRLDYINASKQVDMRALQGMEVNLRSVRILELHLFRCGGEQIKSMLDVIRFPNASSVKLRICGDSDSDGDSRVDDLVHTIMSNNHAIPFPKLVHLDLDVGFHSRERNGQPCPIGNLNIPFTSLLKLNHLTLATTDYAISPFADVSCLPALQSLVLKDCRKLEREWVLQLLTRLRLTTQGSLRPSQLSVEGCQWRELTDNIVLEGLVAGTSTCTNDGGSRNAEYRSITASEMLRLVT